MRVIFCGCRVSMIDVCRVDDSHKEGGKEGRKEDQAG